MKTIISFLKSKQLSRFIVGGFSILFLLVNTACSQPNASGMDGKTGVAKVAADGTSIKTPSTYRKSESPYRKDTDNVPDGQITELYKVIQPEVGGMNTYSDVDPRQNTAKTDAKAKALIQKASHSEADKYDNPLDAVKQKLDDKPIAERIQSFSKNVGKSTQKTADGLSKEVQKGLNNLNESSKDLRDKAQSSADELSKKVQNIAGNTSDTVVKTTQNIANKTQQGVDEVQEFIDSKANT
jgi:ElaB/YqjD/DUF883 family membrane-anchored ribosome-binding protein